MSKRRTHPKNSDQTKKKNVDQTKKIVRITKRTLIFLIVFLIAIILGLIIKVGLVVWPVWMVEYRIQIIGVMFLFILALIFLLPTIIEVESNPQPFSGPGKNPKIDWWKN